MPECGNYTGPEVYRVIVLVIQRHPRDLTGDLAGPGREQRRFAKACRGREQRQGNRAALLEDLQ